MNSGPAVTDRSRPRSNGGSAVEHRITIESGTDGESELEGGESK